MTMETTTKVKVTTTKIEQKEMDGMDGILNELWKQSLLTNFECRIIASTNTIKEKKAAVYSAIMSKSKEDAAILTEAFRSMTADIPVKENSTSVFYASSNEEINCSILQSKNPFLINVIIDNLIGFLPLEDLKRSRLVCHQWNSEAEKYLREKSIVHFRREALVPQTFMEVCKYSLTNVPFPAFVFSNDKEDKNSTWQISKILDFFENCGGDIKELTFDRLKLTTECNLTGREIFIPYYDITELFINPKNLTSLKLEALCEDDEKDTTAFDISLEKFESIKTLSLSYCRIMFPAEKPITRITPLSVKFESVLMIQNEKPAPHLFYNDLIDFSMALNINLDNSWNLRFLEDGSKFDMDKQVFNVKQLHFSHLPYENWCRARGDVQFLRVTGIHVLERNHLKIKQLLIDEDCEIDLTALPETLEILECVDSKMFCSGHCNLPNLKYLFIEAKNIDTLAYFSNCPLVELGIHYNCFPQNLHPFNLSCVPESVKKLKLKMRLEKLNFTDDSIFELDTLILEGRINSSGLKYCKAITAQIKAKVLVVVCASTEDTCPNDIVTLVQANKQSEKILIGTHNPDFLKKFRFDESDFSAYVDKKSNYYQFDKNGGKSITKSEFDIYTKMNDYFPSYFYNTKL